ncbi:MAG: hypothetical protein QOJ07_3904, partial [Thermoleophilaceae bacterium]|nr:hypothetical protein [Thermoleophilaceae bacterium]
MAARIDTRLLRALRTHGHSRPLERGVVAFSRLGEHGGLWLALSGAGWLLDRPRAALYGRAAATVAGAYGVNQLIKLAVRRRRPHLRDLPPLVHTQTQLSYPSAHAATSFAGARALSAAWPAPPLYAAATLMTLTRPYVGVH